MAMDEAHDAFGLALDNAVNSGPCNAGSSGPGLSASVFARSCADMFGGPDVDPPSVVRQRRALVFCPARLMIRLSSW